MVISEMEGSQRKTDVQDRRLSLIDFSSADDSLINPVSENPLNQLHSELLETPNSKKFEDASNKLEEWEQVPQPTETFELEKAKKNSKCNLRKSLAWDTAFFTSAGVLDPEELSSIIEGTEKDEKHALPGIQEDVYKSCESISTLESDSLPLESLEADLFEDIRASIQKSSKMSNATNANSKLPSEVTGFQTRDSVKTVGMASQNKMKVPPASKSASASMQGSGKMTKKNPVCPQFSQKPVASRRESSISKQPKVLGKSSSCPTMLAKRASPSDLPVKSEKDKAKGVIGGRVNSVAKAPVLGNSQRAVPKPTLSSNSSSGPSAATKTKPTKSSGSNSSDDIDNSPFNSSKRKVTGGTIKPPSSSSDIRTPSRIAVKRKTESRNSNLSSLMSVTKISSSISPASSISDWSSESSSSTSITKQSSRTSLESTSSRKVLSDNDTTQASNSQYPPSDSNSEGHETQMTGFVSQCLGTTSAGTVLPPAPMKPSGLRLPSPKIGFFDGVKSLVRTPRGGTQSHSAVDGGLPKHGARSVNPSESENKGKLGKLQPARSIKSISKMKHNHQQNSDAIPHNELSDVAIKMSSACQNKKSSSEIPLEVQNKVPLTSSTGDLKANNTMTEGHLFGTHAPMLGSTRNDGTLDISKNKLNSEIEDSRGSIDVGATPTDQDRNNTDSSSAYHFENTSSEILGESLICGEFNLPKVEGPGIVTHDICMRTSGMYSAEKKEVPDIPLDKINSEGNSGKYLLSNRATLTDGDHDAGLSSATDNNLAITSLSNVVLKAPVSCQLDLVNDVHSSKVVNNQENAHDDQVECLSRQVGSMDISVENVNETTSDSPSLSQSATSSQDRYNGLELSRHKKLLGYSKKEEAMNTSLSTTNFDSPAYARRPFAVKDSFCNMDGLSSVTTESTVSEVKTANLPLPVSIMKNN